MRISGLVFVKQYVIALAVIIYLTGSAGIADSDTVNSVRLTGPEITTSITAPRQITVSWPAVAGASQYNLYIAKQSGPGPDTYSLLEGGTAIVDIDSPFNFQVDEDGVEYFVVVTAVSTGQEVPSKSNDVPVAVPYISHSKSLYRYKPGDFLEFSVMGSKTTDPTLPDSFTGVLRFEYSSTTIPRALSPGETMDVLQEEITLSIDGEEIMKKAVSYINQDASGNIIRLAAGDAVSGLYWFTQSSVTDPFSVLHAPVSYFSPVPNTGTAMIEFYVMRDCESSVSCGITSMTTSGMVDYKGSRVTETVLGYFSTLSLSFDNIYSENGDAGKSAMDYSTLCGGDYTSSASEVYVFPDIGPVSLNVTCASADGEGMTYIANLETTNINW